MVEQDKAEVQEAVSSAREEQTQKSIRNCFHRGQSGRKTQKQLGRFML